MVFPSCRISINPTVDKHVVNICHEGPHVASVGSHSDGTRSVFEGVQITLHWFGEIVKVGLIKAVNGTSRGDANVWMSVEKDALVGIKCETVNS